MRNLYHVTIEPAPEGTSILSVVAVTENSAIRKALKSIFGAVSAAPRRIIVTAECEISDVIT